MRHDQNVEKLLRDTIFEESNLKERLPDFWSLLFSRSEVTSIGRGSEIVAVSDLIFKPVREQFFCINPLDPQHDHGHTRRDYYDPDTPRRADINVTDYRNFMIEMDGISLREQEQIIKQLPIEPTTVVYSGGKSYHCIFSLADPLAWEPHQIESLQKYKQLWQFFADMFDSVAGKTVVDPSSKNCSRLSRIPGAYRDGTLQRLIYLGKLVTVSQLSDFELSEPGLIEQSKFEGINYNISNTQMLRTCMSTGLQIELDYAFTWAGASGMYPELYRLTMWAIDDAAPPKEVLLKMLWEKCFPALLKAGYPRYKLEKAIHDAYRERTLSGR